jgi:hypothetical protein
VGYISAPISDQEECFVHQVCLKGGDTLDEQSIYVYLPLLGVREKGLDPH